LTLDVAENTLTLDCGGDYKGRVVYGPINDLRLGLSHEFKWAPVDYPGFPIKVTNTTEFALGCCDPDPTAVYDQVAYVARHKPNILAEAKEKMDRTRPINVLLLTLDSISRKHAYRKLPQTIDFLNQLNQDENFAVFDFKIHNILGSASVDNTVPIFAPLDRFVHKFTGK
jgi:hypothetical protein